MKELVNDIKVEVEKMLEDLEKGTNGVKAAARRARVSSLKLEKMLKEYRKKSLNK